MNDPDGYENEGGDDSGEPLVTSAVGVIGNRPNEIRIEFNFDDDRVSIEKFGVYVCIDIRDILDSLHNLMIINSNDITKLTKRDYDAIGKFRRKNNFDDSVDDRFEIIQRAILVLLEAK